MNINAVQGIPKNNWPKWGFLEVKNETLLYLELDNLIKNCMTHDHKSM